MCSGTHTLKQMSNQPERGGSIDAGGAILIVAHSRLGNSVTRLIKDCVRAEQMRQNATKCGVVPVRQRHFVDPASLSGAADHAAKMFYFCGEGCAGRTKYFPSSAALLRERSQIAISDYSKNAYAKITPTFFPRILQLEMISMVLS